VIQLVDDLVLIAAAFFQIVLPRATPLAIDEKRKSKQGKD
jgi:hypothetical protein